MIYVNDVGGRIGSFWWLNADCRRLDLISATWKGSHHYVWRPGLCGWDRPGKAPGRFVWRLIP
jgi:hypothetical protein